MSNNNNNKSNDALKRFEERISQNREQKEAESLQDNTVQYEVVPSSDMVVLKFNKPIQFIGISPDEAVLVAKALFMGAAEVKGCDISEL